MATDRADAELPFGAVRVEVMAKAPIAGVAKTRLAPVLGAAGAARLQRRLTLQTLRTVRAAQVGPLTLWCAPDDRHRFFRALQRACGIACRRQPDGDLGARMHACFAQQPAAPRLLVGTDCPVLRVEHLRRAARALLSGSDAVFVPVDDGGYVLVGLARPQPALFDAMRWSTPQVMAETRARAHAAGLAVSELETLWDVDVPADLARLERWMAAAPARVGDAAGQA